MIAQNICHAAMLAGSSVLFRSAPALLEELQLDTIRLGYSFGSCH
jgi:hypothetical protein